MKKTFLSLGILSAFAMNVNAQDAASTSEFKPSAGNITVEVNANSPFKGSDEMFSLNNSALRFRYFLSDGLALRLGIRIAGNRQKQDYGYTTDYSGNTTGNTPSSANGSSSSNPSYKASTSNTLVAIMPGIEVHKNVSERLSVYYGGYIDFALQTARGKVEGTPTSTNSSTTPGTSNSTSASGSYTYEIKGNDLNLSSTAPAPNGNWDASNASLTSPANLPARGGNRAYTRFGVAGVLGADFYVTKALYLGLEVGVGVASTSYKKVTITENATDIVTTTNGVTPTTPVSSYNSTRVENKDTQFDVAPTVNSSFRLGFWF